MKLPKCSTVNVIKEKKNRLKDSEDLTTQSNCRQWGFASIRDKGPKRSVFKTE